MQYCKKCLMPDTRPGSIFNKDGVCQACLNYEKRKNIDWKQREKKLKKLCDKYRRKDGYYDCVIPISGEKDSHFLVYMMKAKMKMNPLLVTVGDPFTKTKAGVNNLRNLITVFNCDLLAFDFSINLFKKATRAAFEDFGDPLRFLETAIRTIPFKTAINYKIPLIILAENGKYEYGETPKESFFAIKFLKNVFRKVDFRYWLGKGCRKEELNCLKYPRKKDINKVKPKPINMSYFVPWSSISNLKIARKYGFQDISKEWQREGYVEHFEQIDSFGYMVHLWLKYPKFGFQRISDIVSRRIRGGRLNLKKGRRLIRENDYKLDRKALNDFIEVLEYTEKEFWQITEKFWNRKMFKKINGAWQLKKLEKKKE